MDKVFHNITINLRLLIIFCLSSIAHSQIELIPIQESIPYRMQAFFRHSGVHDGKYGFDARTISVYRDFIKVSNASWLRLYFSKCDLGRRSYIKITSLEDGEQQHLNSNTLKQWHNTSALFNGDAIEVELYVAPEDKGIFFEIEQIMFGDRGNTSEINTLSKVSGDLCNNEYSCGICGGIDDRVSSNDPSVGRIFPTFTKYGVTGWIASNGTYITAGHAIPGFDAITCLQFNVPKSLPDGTIQQPPIKDQYSIVQAPDSPAPEYDDSGLGQDWAVFSCYPNSETGLLPVEAQNTFYRPTIDNNPTTFRITGFGIDNCPPGSEGEWNSDHFTQQTSTGTNIGEYGSGNDVYWNFGVDITSRNSGSPIIPLDTELSVGIVTHCPCPNYGTSFENDELADTLNTYLSHDIIYVDNGHPATIEDGTIFRPYDTVIEGVNGVPSGGLLCIVKGSYNESLTINKAITIIAPVGAVTIGASGFSKLVISSENIDKDDQSVDNSIPNEFNMSQNYPNPFNTITAIRYMLKEDVKVSLKIFNLMGQEIRTLVDENQSAGYQTVIWDGKNDSGESVPSGVYIYKIIAGKFKKSLELLLLK